MDECLHRRASPPLVERGTTAHPASVRAGWMRGRRRTAARPGARGTGKASGTAGPRARGGLPTWSLRLPPVLSSVLAPSQAGPSTEARLAPAAQDVPAGVPRSRKDSSLFPERVHGNSGRAVIGPFGSFPIWLPPIMVAGASRSVIGQVRSHGLCGNSGKAVIGVLGSCAHPGLPHHGGRGVLTWPLRPGGGSARPERGERRVPRRGGSGGWRGRLGAPQPALVWAWVPSPWESLRFGDVPRH